MEYAAKESKDETSLLTEALNYMKHQRECELKEINCMNIPLPYEIVPPYAILDISMYLLDDEKVATKLELLCRKVNEQLSKYQSVNKYPWLIGGDGVIFSIAKKKNMSYLHAMFRYGISIQDEWYAVALCY